MEDGKFHSGPRRRKSNVPEALGWDIGGEVVSDGKRKIVTVNTLTERKEWSCTSKTSDPTQIWGKLETFTDSLRYLHPTEVSSKQCRWDSEDKGLRLKDRKYSLDSKGR